MWIRSQDKKELIDVINIRCYKELIRGFNAVNDVVLGVYSTEEKALKVMDMIEKHLEKMYVGTSNYMGLPFQMPQDSEVE